MGSIDGIAVFIITKLIALHKMDIQQNQIQAKVKGEFCFLVGDKEMHCLEKSEKEVNLGGAGDRI